MSPATPARRELEVFFVALTAEGRPSGAGALERLGARLGQATDAFLFCHGWLHDAEEAWREACRFFALLETALRPLGERVVPLRIALHWPSKPFAGPGRGESRHAGLWPRLEARLRQAAPGPAEFRELLAELAAAEVPASPEEEFELDALRRRLREPHPRGLLSPFHALSFWVMKRRAGEVGERFGRESLGPLWRAARRAPRLHLVGHSFGAKLVASLGLGGAPAASASLLLAAFSAFAFAPEVPGTGRPGFYARLLDERRVAGPIAVLRSDHDTALRVLYPAVTGSGQLDRHRPGPRHRPGRAGRRHAREVVAASALGAVGARGVAAPEVDLVEVQRIGLPRVAIVNVDGSRVVAAREALVGAHRDIHHPEVARLVLLAAGLLEAGPDGLRPARVSPLARA